MDNNLTRDDLIKMMVGREIGDLFPKQYSEPGEELLRAEHISRPGVLRDCSFSVRRGEVLGFSGLMGAGRTELIRLKTMRRAFFCHTVWRRKRPGHM